MECRGNKAAKTRQKAVGRKLSEGDGMQSL
jgi:hypothetical protein